MYLHHKQNVTELHLTLIQKASSLWHQHPKVQHSTSVDIILGTINPVHTYAVVFLVQFNHNLSLSYNADDLDPFHSDRYI